MSGEKSQPPVIDYAQDRPELRKPRTGDGSTPWIHFAFVAGLIVLAITFLQPALSGSGPSKTVMCMSNLRQIGMVIQLYQNSYNGQFPDSLATIVTGAFPKPAILVCPGSKDTPAPGPTTQAIVNQIAAGGHQSYYYLAGGLTRKDVAGNQVIAYEPMGFHTNGANVLFGDGHVQCLPQKDAQAFIAKIQSNPRPTTVPNSR